MNEPNEGKGMWWSGVKCSRAELSGGKEGAVQQGGVEWGVIR